MTLQEEQWQAVREMRRLRMTTGRNQAGTDPIRPPQKNHYIFLPPL